MTEFAESKFIKFLEKMESFEWPINTTASGEVTIQQTLRNQLRVEGVAALKADLEAWFGSKFDVVETKEGIAIVAENEPTDKTFTWMIRSTIKSLDFDPFIEADNYADELATKAEKKESKAREKEEARVALEAKRAKKLAAVEKLEVRRL